MTVMDRCVFFPEEVPVKTPMRCFNRAASDALWGCLVFSSSDDIRMRRFVYKIFKTSDVGVRVERYFSDKDKIICGLYY